MTPDALPAAWRDRASKLEAYAPPAAEAFRAAARELEEVLEARAEELLTLDEAAEESGYSKRRLRELVSEGTIPNAGRKHAPRLRRSDLPRKPGAGRSDSGGYDPAGDAAELAGRIR